jgi:oligopeptide/dipeptide ABC transporter ATP-binding protein
MPDRLSELDDLLVVEGVMKSFGPRRGALSSRRRTPAPPVVALDDVSFRLGRTEVLGLVGESGSGKSTLARCLVRLVDPDAGSARFDGVDLFAASGAELRSIRRRMQLIYQNPYSSLNPTMTVGSAIGEPARVHGLVESKTAERELVAHLLAQVGLPHSVATHRPRELSGGQRQRVAIARALAVHPEMLIADESVSALDVSVQAQILNLFADLTEELKLTMIFISHQLAVIAHVASRVVVMYRGRIVEAGTTPEIFSSPRHPYTAMLLAAHPDVDRSIPASSGEPPAETVDVASVTARGCPFRSRCAYALPICAEADPPAVDVGGGHISRCHVTPELAGRDAEPVLG